MFNHMFELWFNVVSEEVDAKDVTAAMLQGAILKQLVIMSDNELLDICSPGGTFKIGADT